MPKRKNKQNMKDYIVEHITDFADSGYDEYQDDTVRTLEKQKERKQDTDCDDETNKMWMYKDNLVNKEEHPEEPEPEEEDTSWEDEHEPKESSKEDKKELTELQQKKLTTIGHYMDAAVWFHEMTEQGMPTEEELRYVELMIIELSKFYFGNMKCITPSPKCQEAINNIAAAIRKKRTKK